MRCHIRMGIYPFLLALAAILLYVSAFVTSPVPVDNEYAETNYVSNDDTPTSHSTPRIISDIPVFYTSFQELASRSTNIVIGSVIAPVEMINTARDIDDLSHPDPDYFSISQIYEVEVERYLKGKGEEIIDIVQNQGFLIIQSDPPTTSEIEKARMEYDYIHLHPGQTYLFFVNDA